MNRSLLTLAASLAIATAALSAPMINVITVEGVLTDSGELAGYFGPDPLPFVFRLEYDPAALDVDPNPELGQYFSPGMKVTMDFGTWHFEAVNTEVRVYAGHWGVWGVTFGNADAFEQHGLDLPLYAGLYGSFVGPYLREITPDDSLHWLVDHAHMSGAVVSEYAYVSGMAAEGYVYFQDNGLAGYRVASANVPEPCANALFLGGLIALVSSRRRR